jgi:hypothetical protein
MNEWYQLIWERVFGRGIVNRGLGFIFCCAGEGVLLGGWTVLYKVSVGLPRDVWTGEVYMAGGRWVARVWIVVGLGVVLEFGVSWSQQSFVFYASLIVCRVCFPLENAGCQYVLWFFTEFREVTLAIADTTRIAISIRFGVAVVLASMALGKVLPGVRLFDFNFGVAKWGKFEDIWVFRSRV